MRARLAAAAAVIGVTVAADLLTKRWAARSFRDAPAVVVDPFLRFTFVENPGSAFSLFQGAGTLLALAAFVALGMIAGALRRARGMGEVVGFALIGGGALGNLIDRIARGPGLLDGTVIDWIQVPNFPVFNLADSAITVGVGLLLITAWRQSDRPDTG
ncbi:MAG: hypothetical protein KatS3mg011_1842 [Acidimicrobiia bacterium]|nr:MAG: hypothetical protein KatS3mg011_1842 [Acidimicrobiia bacterium]